MHHRTLLSAALAFALAGTAFTPVAASTKANTLPERALISRTSPSGNYLAGRFAFAKSNRDMAAAAMYYRAALRADPKNEDLLERTFISTLAQGAVDEAAPLAERLVAHDRNQRISRLAIAARSLKKAQYKQARAQLSPAIRGPVADLTATLMLAWALAGDHQTQTAVTTISRLQGPDWYAAFKDLHIGLILDYAGSRAQAGTRLAAAYRYDPTSVRTVDAYARWLSRNGKPEEAKKVYGEFAKVLPHHPLVDQALAELNAGKQLAPLAKTPAAGAAEALFGLGTALGRQGGEEIGLVYLQLAIYLDPGHPLALLSLADLYETMKKPDLAVETYERIPANAPLKRNADIHRALNLEVLERHDEATKALEEIVKNYPDDQEAIVALGNVLRARKQYAQAAEVYTKAIDRIGTPGKQNWSLYFYRGNAYERAKEWPKAEKDLEKALELFPDQPQVLNYLGYSWVDQGINLEKGLKMVRRAVELRPNDGYIVDSLGWAQYRLGNYQAAVDALERAIELKPEDPVLNDHLGDAYWKVGRELEARFQWRHARDNKPEPEDLARIEDKLKNGLDGASKAGALDAPKQDKGG
ncbi:MAG TPA: tetratricopeptide repeat protein [Xanthobacteraceae bacterium]|nr:tetratricopeptide repeat protein [Xanthobacteraceae bacterium]